MSIVLVYILCYSSSELNRKMFKIGKLAGRIINVFLFFDDYFIFILFW